MIVDETEIRDYLSADQLYMLEKLSDIDTELIYKKKEYRERKETLTQIFKEESAKKLAV